jgi:hypothetical protein
MLRQQNPLAYALHNAFRRCDYISNETLLPKIQLNSGIAPAKSLGTLCKMPLGVVVNLFN